MKFEEFEIEGPILCKPNTITDQRGFFSETYRKDLLENFSKQKFNFCQTNFSRSKKGVLRGLHFQTYPHSQTKLLSVSKGEVLDLIVDLRKNSDTYGQGIKIILNDTNHFQLLIPKGFAHGFLVLSEIADVNYQVDSYFNKDCDFGINSLDPKLNFNLDSYCKKITRSPRDCNLPNLEDSAKFRFL